MKAMARSALGSLAKLKARCLRSRIGAGSRVAFSADVRHSELLGKNLIGRRSVVHATTLGEYSYVGDDCRIINVAIGTFSSLGSGIKTAFGRHPYQFLSQHPATYSLRAEMTPLARAQLFDQEHVLTEDGRFVSIGHDVWIGDDVKIFDGVTIGHGAVIGTGSLVTRSVPAYAIVRGSPAAVVRFRFPENDIATLLELQWWRWDRALLARAVNERLLCGAVGALRDFHDTHTRGRV
jgi:acetyltransferase-like isoleucine patch superfamily enzyme